MSTHLHHSHCFVHQNNINERMIQAQQLCESQGGRFTALRQDIYRLILQSKKPLGAYDLISQLQELRKSHDKHVNIAPPTVYRSLEFLLAHGLIHQLNSISAFIPCCHPRQNHIAAFLICQNCHSVQECSSLPIDEFVRLSQKNAHFLVKKSIIELSGICQNCQAIS